MRFVFIALLISSAAIAAPKTVSQEFLVKFTEATDASDLRDAFPNTKIEKISDTWFKVEMSGSKSSRALGQLKSDPDIEFVQPNYAIRLPDGPKLQDALRRAAVERFARKNLSLVLPTDNPEIAPPPTPLKGEDPLLDQQWALQDMGVREAWKSEMGKPEVIVAILDSGVDYTHEDLRPNLWRNPGETGLDSQGRDKSRNGIDDDLDGLVDDAIGWDFFQNDNRPFDLPVDPLTLLYRGGNAGHGTHCAGVIAAAQGNSVGGSGIAPQVRLMSLRFISQQGVGSTANAVKAIHYAVDHGAKILSSPWESAGEDRAKSEQNRALREAIQYAQDHGVLFIAAAGNGLNGTGYDNDSSTHPASPASYENENIVSVTAIDTNGQRGTFANWGAKSVDLAAPGVDIFSTMVGGGYSNLVLDQFGFRVSWDGTSMAVAQVAGAAALYWSKYPDKTFAEVKHALISTAKKIPSMENSSVSEGKLDVRALIQQ